MQISLRACLFLVPLLGLILAGLVNPLYERKQIRQLRNATALLSSRGILCIKDSEGIIRKVLGTNKFDGRSEDVKSHLFVIPDGVHHVNFRGKNVGNDDLDWLARQGSLRTLTLSGTSVDGGVISIAPRINQLALLDISRSPATPLSLNSLVTCRALHTLNLSNCPNVTDEIWDVIEKLRCLKRLSLYGTRISHISRTSVCTTMNLGNTPICTLQGLDRHGPLERLFIENTCISDLRELQAQAELVEFDASNTPIRRLASLSFARKLKTLDLANTNVVDCSDLSSLSTIENLDLSYTDIFEISSLAQLVHLIDLDLSGTAVRELGILGTLKSLRFLRLCEMKITDLSHLAKLPKLEYLDLSGADVDETQLQALRRSLNKRTSVRR